MLWVTKAVETFDPLSVLSELGCQALKIRGCKSAHVSRKPALCKEIYQKEKQLQWRFIGTFCGGSSHLFFAKRLTPPFGFLLSMTVQPRGEMHFWERLQFSNVSAQQHSPSSCKRQHRVRYFIPLLSLLKGHSC